MRTMNFAQVITAVCTRLDEAEVRYAVIGGFAMALRGVQRATADLDLILMLEDLGTAHEILVAVGYQREFSSENVSHYRNPEAGWGRIDILHAFRGPTLGMLKRADRIAVADDLSLPVVQLEDIAGLKVQALANDPSRTDRDWSDIRLLVRAARERSPALDWELLGEYLRLFGMEQKLAELKSIHDAIE
jgi:hypothetical protein